MEDEEKLSVYAPVPLIAGNEIRVDKVICNLGHSCRFYLREKLSDSLWADGFTMDPQLIRDYFYRFLYQPQDREYPDLCQLPDLNEQTLLDNLRARFNAGHIYTYVGSILIAVNPFKVILARITGRNFLT